MPVETKLHFILVHGACHGGWCWYRIVDLLQRSGYSVTAVDLAGSGIHPADANEIKSFDQYNKPLQDLLRSLPESEKVILVGHSMGGLSLVAAAESFPQKISVAVYLAALMIPGGLQDETDIRLAQPPKEIQEKLVYHFPDEFTEIPTSIGIPQELQEHILYGSCPSKDVALASMLLRPFPARIFQTAKIMSTDEGFGRVPRVYIRAEKDKLLETWKQTKFIENCPPQEVHSMDTDHSPFFSAPEKLYRMLMDIATRFAS